MRNRNGALSIWIATNCADCGMHSLGLVDVLGRAQSRYVEHIVCVCMCVETGNKRERARMKEREIEIGIEIEIEILLSQLCELCDWSG